MLVLSDPLPNGFTPSVEDCSIYMRLVDERYRLKLPTIVTCNAKDLDDLRDSLGTPWQTGSRATRRWSRCDGRVTEEAEMLATQEEIELAVLGSMLLQANAATYAIAELQEDDFYHLSHQTIFRAISLLVDEGSAIDVVLLGERLNRLGKLQDVGGPEMLFSSLGNGATLRAHQVLLQTLERMVEATKSVLHVRSAAAESGRLRRQPEDV